MSLLLESAPDGINSTRDDGCTALHMACMNDKLAVAKALLDHGADMSLANKESFTPLHAAAWYQRKQCAELLVQRGAPLEARSKNKSTVRLGCRLEIPHLTYAPITWPRPIRAAAALCLLVWQLDADAATAGRRGERLCRDGRRRHRPAPGTCRPRHSMGLACQ